MPVQEIDGIEEEMRIHPESRKAQKRLAFEVTRMVHGEEQARRMERGAESLYSGNLEELDADLIHQVFSEGPTAQISRERLQQGVNVIDLAVETGLLKSKGEARRQLKSGAIYINNQRLLEARSIDQDDLLPSGCVILRKGKTLPGAPGTLRIQGIDFSSKNENRLAFQSFFPDHCAARLDKLANACIMLNSLTLKEIISGVNTRQSGK